MAAVHSINVSKRKGVKKAPVNEVTITALGLEGDAHAGPWHRQVSLLGKERIDEFGREHGTSFENGDFAENITTVGVDLDMVALGDRIQVGGSLLEVTQIGKKCHGDGCEVFKRAGVCVMPKRGLFARVISPGEVKVGDSIAHVRVPLRVVVVTVSDRVTRGEYEDRSGPEIARRLEEIFEASRRALEVEVVAVPDEADAISEAVKGAIGAKVDIAFTTGGTGIGPRDITPDVVRPLLEKELPGIMEAIRVKTGQKNPNALVSRSIAGCAGRTLIYCVPGSVRAVNEYLDTILPTVDHAMRMLKGSDDHRQNPGGIQSR